MDKKDKIKLIEHYNQLFKKHGYSHKSLGWGKKRHFFRYEILISDFELANKSILDFGCGFGDFFEYLKSKKICDVKYEGIDINENFIRQGKKKYKDAKLYHHDPFQDGLISKYDYIVSSGVHNTKITDNLKFVEQTFDLFDKYSKYGFAMNFLSNTGDFFEQELFYADPSSILNIAMKYSKKVILKHDYMPFEFTIVVFKNYKIVKDLNVFSDYSPLLNEN